MQTFLNLFVCELDLMAVAVSQPLSIASVEQSSLVMSCLLLLGALTVECT